MRRWTAAVLVAAALGIAACGGEDESTTTTAPAAAEGAEGASYDVTVDEFLVALEPDKATMIEDFVADNPQDCKGVEAKNVLTPLSVEALEAPPDTPLPEFLLEHTACGST